jgi:DNA-binding MarR family transcriptional regulator
VTADRPARPFLELWARARRSVRVVADALAERGIGDNELAALLHLSAHEEGMTISELASEMGAAFMSVSDAVTRLERDGDAERVPHPSDRRAQLVRLTRTGRKRARDAERVLATLTKP